VGSTVATSSPDFVPAGATMWLRLDETISDDDRPGDTFTATVDRDVVSDLGEVLVPAGARVIGRIVAIQRARDDRSAAVQLSLEELRMGGVSQPIAATIVETELAGQGRSVRGKDVLIGAAAGAILGALIEGGEGAVVGGLLGAGAGTAISLGRGGDDDELKRGSLLGVRLDQEIESYASVRGGRRVY
jgi:hypothetical protein